LFSFDP